MSKKKPVAPKSAPKKPAGKTAETYTHPGQTVAMRPEVGTQAQFRKKKPPQTYRYDSSLSPVLEWDESGTRELGEWLLSLIEQASALPPPHTFPTPQEFTDTHGAVVASVSSLHDAVARLRSLSKPFLNWTGKAERLSFDVPTMPLFVHERLSTKAIVETLVGHKSDKQANMFDLFGDPQHSIADQTLRAYEFPDKWTNRLILGDSLVVMNSLLRYEKLGGQVQMIYIDPPYGVKFGSNFQPFVRKRDVSHSDDEDFTREPEMVKAYRDTWELGLHSYLTYMRDRLLVARDLLTQSGSVFVQISDENLHHLRELLDEVFGAENFVSQIAFLKTSGFETSTLSTVNDSLLWYAKSKTVVKVRKLFIDQPSSLGEGNATWLLMPDGTSRGVTADESNGRAEIPDGARPYLPDNLVSQGSASTEQPFTYLGKTYLPPEGSHWKAHYPDGMQQLADSGRIHVAKNSIRYRRFADDFSFQEISNIWTDTRTGNFTDPKLYVVQTASKVAERCLLLTTDPGDLVLDPTCGSGTTAYVAEQWGRRWITIDTSRVPLALARQRLLTATYAYYRLKDTERGPAGGFVYAKKQNKKGEEVGGIVPHVTLGSIANSEPANQEVLVHRPEEDNTLVRVTGPFAFEATIPTPVDWDDDGIEDSGTGAADEYGSFVERMIEVLRRSPVLHVGGGKTVTVGNVRPPARSLSLSAEGVVAATAEGQAPTVADAYNEAIEKTHGTPYSGKSVAFVFGPENGAISEKLVHAALQEAQIKRYTHLYVIGFAIQPHARQLIENSTEMGLVPATYVQATPDLMMGDLLKNMRSSQIFSVCGLPEVKVHHAKAEKKDGPSRFSVELIGLDTFDPTTMNTDHRPGHDVPCWMLDADYNNLCFRASQVFFPRTGAWNDLKKALKGDYDDAVWDHLAGTTSAPFEAGEHKQIAVKVIDDRGNELLVVKSLGKA